MAPASGAATGAATKAATKAVSTSAATATTTTTAAATTTSIFASKGAIALLAVTAVCTAVVVGVAVGVLSRDDPAPPAPGPVLRTYYLAAEETLWDYAPGYTSRSEGYDNCTGSSASEDHQGVFLASEAQGSPIFGAIGSSYIRRVWRGYTDATFTTPLPQPKEWAHAGFFGPVLRAAVGDTVRVVVKNRSRHPAAFHALGLRLVSVVHAPRAHGAHAHGEPEDLTAGVLNATGGQGLPTLVLGGPGKSGLSSPANTVLDPFSGGFRTFSPVCPAGMTCEDDGEHEQGPQQQQGGGTANVTLDIEPGAAAVYTWFVPESAGPLPGSSASAADTVPHLYQSLGYSTHDLSLSGLIVVSRAGGGGYTSDPAVASEHLILLSVADENASPYLALNLLDRVLRPRYVASHQAGDFPTLKAAAAQPGSPVFPLLGVDRELLFAALVSAATGGEEEVDPSSAAVYSATHGNSPSSPTTVAAFNGVPLGLTFDPASDSLDATAFVAVYGQELAEDAIAAVLADELVFASPDFDAAAFEESNLMHSLNGYVYCNVPDVHMKQGTKPRWYIAVLGSEVDGHTFHWHGNVLSYGAGWRADSIPLLPRSVIAADMDAENPGTWLFHCHVTDHIHAGMILTYHVMPSPAKIPTDAFASPATLAAVAAAADALPAPPVIAPSLKGGKVRDYFIAAEYVEDFNHTEAWGQSLCEEAAPGAVLPEDGVPSISIPRVRYIAFTDATFRTKAPQDPTWAHTGLLGPVLRAVVGDTIRITLLNRSPRPASLHPHGVFYRKNAEGAPYADGTTGLDTGDDSVLPGANWTYVWFVPESAGPASERDGSSLLWLYHGHVHEAEDENTGLLGGILVTKRGMETSATNPRPKDVDREFLLIFKVFEPVPLNASHIPVHHRGGGGGGHSHRRRLLSSSAAARGGARSLGGGGEDDDAEHPDVFTINGLSYCSLPALSMVQGEKVRFYLGSLGNEIDSSHFATFGGHAVTWHGHTVAGIPLLAGTMQVADLVATVPGTWLLADGSQELAVLGTQAAFVVEPDAAAGAASGLTAALEADEADAARTYYISADEVEWSYIADGPGPAADLCVPSAAKAGSPAFEPEEDGARFDEDGTDLDAFPADARIFVRRDGPFLGHTYTKAVYRLYPNGSFVAPVPRAHGGADEHLGLLGPILRGAVGETIRIVFRHNLRSGVLPAVGLVPSSALVVTRVRRHNFTTNKWDVVVDTTSSSSSFSEAHGAVAAAPGEQLEYLVFIPPSAGPGSLDPDTVLWTYTSPHNPSEALYAGLIGPIVVARNAAALASPGVDREFVLASLISNENLSPYFHHNLHAKAVGNASLIDVESDEFLESNLYHSINGKLMCGAQGFDAEAGERVRWHLIGLGGALDIHSPTFHGGMGLAQNGAYKSTLDIYPGQTASADMLADAPGSWLVECGLVDHFVGGMRAIFNVRGGAGTYAGASAAAPTTGGASSGGHSHRLRALRTAGAAA